jgi:hypothetical protein
LELVAERLDARIDRAVERLDTKIDKSALELRSDIQKLELKIVWWIIGAGALFALLQVASRYLLP